MSDQPPKIRPEIFESSRASHIYLLPNLMTAGNLFCGFVAVIRCLQAHHLSLTGHPDESMALYAQAVWFILAAIVFDALDGRLARLGGRESLFGKEFDSIADIISFGIAPALLVFSLILQPTEEYPFFQRIGWFLGFIYLLCAAIRLARFNVITHPAVYSVRPERSKDFIGLPVPAAAGTIASLVFFMNSYELRQFAIAIPVLMLLIAYLMVSVIRFPSFKEIDWRTRLRFRTFIIGIGAAVLVWQWWSVGLVLIFLAYIFFSIGRHVRRSAARGARLRELEEERPALVESVRANREQDGDKS